MKIKKLFIPILLVVMLLPFIVIAETCDTNSIKIESINVKEKQGSVSETEPAKINGTTINLNLNMVNVGDSISYDMVIKNTSDEDLELDNNSINVSSDYIEYNVESSDNSNIVPANSSKTMTVKIKYKTKVNDSSYQNGKYNDNKTMTLNISNDSTSNPFTNDLVLIYLLLFYISLFIFVVLFKKNKKTIVPITITILALPFSIKALCKSEITINSKVLIENNNILSYRYECSGNTFNFTKGMTFREWIKSDYFKGNISGYFTSQEKCNDLFGDTNECVLKETDTKYSYKGSYEEYRLTLDDCINKDKCRPANKTLYHVRYALVEYNSMEECEQGDRYQQCKEVNGRYLALLDTLDEDESYYNFLLDQDYPFTDCTPVTDAYIETVEYYRDFYSAQNCEEYNETGIPCFERNIYYYGPVERDAKDSSLDGEYTFYDDGFEYLVNGVWGGNSYDEKIIARTYYCDAGAECVSPESDISSSNGITIKAKNIKVNDKVTYYDFNTNKIEIGTVSKVYIHKDASNLIRYTLSDNTYLEVTDYHPIYTKDGWKSYTGRNGYSKPKVGDLVKTNTGYKMIKSITPFRGKEDYYDFQIKGKDGKSVKNYFANGILVEGSY